MFADALANVGMVLLWVTILASIIGARRLARWSARWLAGVVLVLVALCAGPPLLSGTGFDTDVLAPVARLLALLVAFLLIRTLARGYGTYRRVRRVVSKELRKPVSRKRRLDLPPPTRRS